MDLAGLPELAAMFALGYGAALFLDLEQRTVGVLAGGGAMALDAGLATDGRQTVISARTDVVIRDEVALPGVLLVADKNLGKA